LRRSSPASKRKREEPSPPVLLAPAERARLVLLDQVLIGALALLFVVLLVAPINDGGDTWFHMAAGLPKPLS